MVKVENKHMLPQGPVSLKNEDIVDTDQAKVADLLNKHFIRASNLFENQVIVRIIKRDKKHSNYFTF